MRELVRYRRSLIQERSREHNRVQNVLEGANIKLASVVSDMMGLSSRDMLEAMVGGETDPETLAGLACRSMKRKKEKLELALKGNMSSHQRMMLKTMLTHIDFLSEQIIELDMEVAKRLAPFKKTWIDWIAFRESRPERLNKSLLRLAPTLLLVSQVQLIYAHGLVLFQVTMKAQANASPPKHAKAINICSSKLLTLYEDLIIILVPNTGELQLAKEGTAQLLLLRISS